MKTHQTSTVLHDPMFMILISPCPLPHLTKFFAGAGSEHSDSASSGEDLMPDFGLFEAAHIACPVLPQYHPRQLTELLGSGKIRWVKAILGHLVRCISGPTDDRLRARSTASFGEDGSKSPRAWSRSRTLSVGYGGASGGGVLSPGGEGPGSGHGGSTSAPGIPEELTLDYAEINSIPPLPLWTLLAADQETGSLGGPEEKSGQGSDGYDDLFAGGNAAGPDMELDDILEEEVDGRSSSRARGRKRSLGESKQGLSYFGPKQARVLSKLLTHAHLPGLSNLDQMHLLALADTVANCQLDLADRFAIDAAKQQIAKESGGGGLGAGANAGEPSPGNSRNYATLVNLSLQNHWTIADSDSCWP